MYIYIIIRPWLCLKLKLKKQYENIVDDKHLKLDVSSCVDIPGRGRVIFYGYKIYYYITCARE